MNCIGGFGRVFINNLVDRGRYGAQWGEILTPDALIIKSMVQQESTALYFANS